MRRDPTFAEKQLWKQLRQLDGFHFRRQAPMGAFFVVDFVCHRSRLIVEVDGGARRAPDVAERDAERSTWLSARGYRVVRISNPQAIHDPDAAIAAILAGASDSTPTPNPSPQGGGD